MEESRRDRGAMGGAMSDVMMRGMAMVYRSGRSITYVEMEKR